MIGRLALLAAAAVLGAACAQAPRSSAPSPEALALGEKLYDEWACSACHGADRAGTENAPPLLEARTHWTVDALARYLLDPQSVVATDPRLRTIGARYQDMDMPPFDYPLEERRAVAAWVIDRSR